MVMQRPAKPCTPVRFRLPPPKYQSECKPQVANSRCGIGLNQPYINQHGGVAECLCCAGCNPRIGRLKSAPPPPIIQADKPQPGPSGGIGRHNGLKIRRSLIRAYRFDSGLGHHKTACLQIQNPLCFEWVLLYFRPWFCSTFYGLFYISAFYRMKKHGFPCTLTVYSASARNRYK